MSLGEKLEGRFSQIGALDLPEHHSVRGWIKGLDFPVLLLSCAGETLETIYQKRWKVENFHKTLKSNAALAKSPTKTERTQGNHCFMALSAAFRLEGLAVKRRINHFASRFRLYIKAIRYAFE